MQNPGRRRYVEKTVHKVMVESKNGKSEGNNFETVRKD